MYVYLCVCVCVCVCVYVCVWGMYGCLFAGDPVGVSDSYVHAVMIFGTLLL